MKKILMLGLLLALIAGAFVYYQYQRAPQGMDSARTDFSVDATELFAAFESDEEAANQQYLDKVIELKGTVKEVNTDDSGRLSLTLEGGDELFGVICQFDPRSPQGPDDFQAGQAVTIKGVCTGMLMDVVLVRCIAL
jgi:hypothetical protein